MRKTSIAHLFFKLTSHSFQDLDTESFLSYHIFKEIHSQVPVACWMLGEQMREKKMMIAPRASRPPVFAANGKPNGRH